jgi:WD40 repeat protein
VSNRPTSAGSDQLSRQLAKWRRLAFSFAGLAAVAIAAAVAAVTVAAREQDDASLRERLASHERVAASRDLAAAAYRQLDQSPEVAMLLALEAFGRVRREPPESSYEARHSLLVALERNARLTAVLQSKAGQAEDVAFSPDGETLAIVNARDDERAVLRLWDVARGASVGEELSVRDLSQIYFSPDGQRLFAESPYGQFAAFDVARTARLGDPLDVSVGFEDDVGSIGASPDGRWIAVYGDHGLFEMWDTDRRAPVRRFLTAAPSFGGFSPDSQVYAEVVDVNGCVCGAPGPMRLWDLARRTEISKPPPYTVSDFAFAPDGRTMAIGTGKRVILWDLFRKSPDRPPLTVVGGAVQLLVYSADGSRLAAAGSDGSVTVWDLRRFEPVGRKVRVPGGEDVVELQFSPDGRMLVVGKWRPSVASTLVTLWDSDTRRPLINPPRFPTLTPEGYTELAFSPDSKTLAAASDDGRLRLWEVGSETPLVRSVLDMGPHGVVGARALAISPDGRMLASAGEAGGVLLWDVERGAAAGKLVIDSDFEDVIQLAFSPDGRKLAVAHLYKRTRLWDVQRRSLLGVFPGADPADLVFSPDGGTLAMGGPVRLFNVESRMRLGKPLGEGSGVAFSEDGRTLATAEPVRFWNVERREAIGPPLRLEGAAERAFEVELFSGRVVFSKSLRSVAVAAQGVVRLWAIENGEAIGGPPLRHAADVNGIAFSPDGQVLASVGSDDVMKLWDVSRRAPLGEPLPVRGGFPWGVAFSPDGSTVVSGHYDETIRFWDSILLSSDLDTLRERVCNVVGRNLTDAEWRSILPGASYRKICPQLD